MTGIHDDRNLETRLLALARGEHDPVLEQHVETCATCSDSLFTLRRLQEYRTTTGGTLVEPPLDLITRVTGLMSTIRPDLIRKVPASRDPLQAIRQIVADLILDSGITPQVVGLRSSADRRTRQFAFVSDVADLDLEVTPRDDAWSISGQLGMDTVPKTLRIRFVPSDSDVMAANAEGAVEAIVSHDGYFGLNLTGGEWVAAIDIDDATVLFQGIHV